VESGSAKVDSIANVAGGKDAAESCDRGGVDGASEDAIGDSHSRDVFVAKVDLAVLGALSSGMGFGS
jgi:hypothetical protein